MSDELTRAIAEVVRHTEPEVNEIAAALTPLIEARVSEARANEIEHILTHILTGPRSPATNALERRLAELRYE